MNQNVTLIVNIEETNLILEALADLPAKRSYNVLSKLIQQIQARNAQQQAQTGTGAISGGSGPLTQPDPARSPYAHDGLAAAGAQARARDVNTGIQAGALRQAAAAQSGNEASNLQAPAYVKPAGVREWHDEPEPIKAPKAPDTIEDGRDPTGP